MRYACWVSKATYIQSEYVIVLAIARRQRLHQRVSVTFIHTLPVVLIVRMERSTAWRNSGTVLKRMARSGSFILGIKWKSQGLKIDTCFEVLLSFSVVSSIVYNPLPAMWKSQGLSPCDFDLIPKMKDPLRGIRFRTVPEILQAVDRSIRTINTTGAAKGILRLPHRW